MSWSKSKLGFARVLMTMTLPPATAAELRHGDVVRASFLHHDSHTKTSWLVQEIAVVFSFLAPA